MSVKTTCATHEHIFFECEFSKHHVTNLLEWIGVTFWRKNVIQWLIKLDHEELCRGQGENKVDYVCSPFYRSVPDLDGKK